jgi:exoribonuclease R
MTNYKIMIHDKNYSDFSFVNDDTNEDVIASEENQLVKVDPIKQKLFSKDVISFENNEPIITYSHVRSCIPLAGILMLENNKTFGRTPNKKRLLYKCIPDDKHLPAFLIPYEIQLSFSKVQKNKYVIFKYLNWDQQHPHGIIVETLGDVGNLDVFYEYQLYCKSLHVSLSDFTNKTREQLQQKSQIEYIDQILRNPNYNIEDRRHIKNIFTIDPLGSSDFDDAFSIESLEKRDTYKLSIYIANVYFWLETLGLWKSFSSRVSTIYLPDRRRPMLPTILSDSLCSLQECHDRFAFVMDIIIKCPPDISNSSNKYKSNEHIDITPTIESIEYKNVIINVKKNYHYEDHNLLYNNSEYTKLLMITTQFDASVIDSHDVVAYWMVKMNIECGNYMASKKIGIFRLANYIHSVDQDFHNEIAHLDENTKRTIKNWSNTTGQYIVYDGTQVLEHELMKKKNYIHITSPIRRLVDLLNQIWISKSLSIINNVSCDAEYFFNNWLQRLDYLNASMRSIRKIQTDCSILHECFMNTSIMNTVYTGTIFDKIKKNDGSIVYMVYLENLKLLSRLKTYDEYDNYTKHSFRIFLFEDEYRVKKKIRIQIVE